MPTLLPRPPLRARRRLLRPRPLPYWFLAVAVAVGSGAVVAHLVAGAAAERDRWGRLRPTLVATASVAAGDRVTAGAVRVRRLPAALVPDGALRSLPPGALAVTDLHRGEPVLAARVVGRGGSAVAARLPPGWRGVAVPSGTGLPLRVGDRVQVLATFDPEVAGDEPTFAVARLGLVVHVGDDAVTVGVPEAAAPRVAYALAAGTVTLVLSGTS